VKNENGKVLPAQPAEAGRALLNGVPRLILFRSRAKPSVTEDRP
jgi:hypothetical protein